MAIIKLDREVFLTNAKETKDIVADDGTVIGLIAIMNVEGKFVAKGFSGKKAKSDWHYVFKTWERMDDHIHRYTEQLQKGYKEKLARKAYRTIVNSVNNFQVGDILHYSWGYDQTNAEFFQVTEVKAKTVKIREIGCKAIEGSQYGDSDSVRPVKDSFLTGSVEEVKVAKQSTVNPNSRYVSMRFGSASLVIDPENSKFYRSWGR